MRRSSLLAVVLILVSSGVFAASGPFTTKVAFTSDRDGNLEIYVVNPSGAAPTRLTNNPAIDTQASFSRDGKKIAFMSERDGNSEIYVMNADGSSQTRLTNDPAPDSQPTWSPDGTRIVFQSNRAGNVDIFAIAADGIGLTQQLTNDPGFDQDPAFSPQGDKIVFSSSRDGNQEIYSMNANGTAQTRLTNNTTFDSRPDFSPSGLRIVFNSNVFSLGGGFSQQVVIMNASGSVPKVLTSAGSNGNPAFSPDGNRIFFNSTRDQNTEIYSMAVDGSNQTRMTNNTFGDTQPSAQGLFKVETVGVYRPATGQWILSTANASGEIALLVDFAGLPGDLPVAGNWNGDTRTDLGFFRNGTFHLGLLKTGITGTASVDELPTITFGQLGDRPIAGDWDGDGIDDVGVFRAGNPGKFLLRQPRTVFVGGAGQTATIITTITFDFGQAGDLPVAGDWDGDGIDTPGVYRPGDQGPFLLTNEFANVIDHDFAFGGFEDRPLAGDWLGAGRDGVGLIRDTGLVFLGTELFAKVSIVVDFGQPGDLPVAGSWLP